MPRFRSVLAPRLLVTAWILISLAWSARAANASDLVGIRVTPAGETMSVGDSRQYFATAIYSDNTSADITSLVAWSSSMPTVASIDTAGIASGLAVGDTGITASFSGFTGTVTTRVRGVDAYVYASGWGLPNGVRGYQADLISGQLTTDLGTAPSGATPTGIAIDPGGRWLFTANRFDNTVTAFAISAGNGTLVPIATYPSNGAPFSALVEPTGRFLYIGNLTGNSISAFAIGADGSLTPVAGSPIAVPGVVAMAAHPSGAFLYFSTGLDHRIAAYRIGNDGALTPVPGSPYWFDNFGSFNNLLGLTAHRNGRFLIASDNSTSSIRVFTLDPATGALTAEAFRIYNLSLSRGIIAHPDGVHVIAAGQGTIHSFNFNTTTGALTPVAGSPFASSLAPQAIVLDPSGTRLYAVNGDQGGSTLEGLKSISLHYVDPSTGIVTKFGSVDAGASLMGIALTASNAAGPSLSQVTVSPIDPTIVTTNFGITQSFTAIGTYSDGRSGPLTGVTWASSDPSVATIDPATGVATPHGYGSATITATRTGISDNTTLTVTAAPQTALYVAPVAATMAPGGSAQLTATALFSDGITLDATSAATWTSASPAIASVVNGIVLGVSPGVTAISATVNGFTASSTVHVTSGTVIAYSVDRTGGKIYAYQRATGATSLAAVIGSPLGGVGTNPEAVALDPSGRFLFVADNPNNLLYAFQVDGASGNLLPAPGSPFTTRNSPARIAVDPLGRFVYVVNRGDRRLSAYTIDAATGRLTAIAGVPEMPVTVRSLAFDASGRFLFIGVGQGSSTDSIRTLQIDAATGALTPASDIPTGQFPESLVIDPAGRFLYAANGGDNVVSRYAINPATGALALRSTTPTGIFPYRLGFHPSGNVLYVGVRTNSTLTSFAVSAAGALSMVAQVPVFGGINSLAVESSGDYIYVDGEQLALYSVNGAGALNKIQDYVSGNWPYDVTIGTLAPSAPVAPTALTIDPASVTVSGSLPGGKQQFVAIGTYADGSQAFLTNSATWATSSPGQVSISNTGLATSLTVPGTSIISAAFGGQIATATFSASNAPTRLIVAPAIETIGIGSVRTYRAIAVYPGNISEDVTDQTTWTSSDSAVASVTNEGAVTALVHGDASITATYLGVSGAAIARVRNVDAFLYASAWGLSENVRGFHADLITGALSDAGLAPSGVSPWAVAIEPLGRWLYVTNRTSDTVSAFAIDATSGVLTPIATYPTGGNVPFSTQIDAAGRFLYVGNLTGLSIAAYAIGADGSLSAVPGSPFAVPGVVAMAAHPSGEYLYYSTGLDHHIAAARIAANGALMPVAGSPYWFDDFGAFNNLLGLAADRSGRFLLASDNSTHSIRVFSVDVATGALTGEVFRVDNLFVSRSILAHADGSHIIAAGNNGGIYVFTMNPATGALTAVPGSPFSSSFDPQALAFDHTGTKLYGINGDQGAPTIEAMRTISLHHFDPATGAVSRFGTLDTGGILMGLAIAASNTAGPSLNQIAITPAGTTVETTVFDLTRIFSAIGTYSDGRSGPLAGATWQSSNPSIVVIDPQTGVVTVKGYGTVTITASRSGVSGQTSLTVAPAPAVALYVSPAATQAAPGSIRQFTARVLYSDGVSEDVSASAAWTSSQLPVAAVAAGTAVAASAGTTTIGATFRGLSASGTLTVKSGTILAYAIDRSGARAYGYQRGIGASALTAVTGSPFAGVGSGPQTVMLDPTGRFLFAADTPNDRLYAFQVDGVTGQLLAVPGSPFVTRRSPSRLAIDPRGRFLYVVYQAEFRISAFTIDQADGHLSPTTVDQTFTYGPRSITVDSTGRFVFVGAGQGDGNDYIRTLLIDQSTGGLTTIADVPTGRFPMALVTDPADRFLYVANGGANQVAKYAIHPGTGELSFVDTTAAGNFPYRLAMHPSGRVLYVGVSSNSTLTSFTVAPGTGALSPVTQVPVFGGITGMAMESSGEYLYVAGEQLALYSVDAAGALIKLHDYAAGTIPMDVTVATLAPAAPVTLTALSIVPAAATIYRASPGGSRQLVAIGTYSDGSQAFLTTSAAWSTSDAGAIGISATGLATVASVPSSATISAVAFGLTATATITASNTPSRVVVMPLVETISVGATRSFRATAIYADNDAEDITASTSWSSSNPAIASVDGAGAVTGVTTGDAIITGSYLGIGGTVAARVRGLDAYLYASSWGFINGLHGYHADLATGQLTGDLGTAASGLSPWSVAIDPAGRFVYVTNYSEATVSGFAINPLTGALTLIATYPTGGNSPYVAAIDPGGRFLYVGNLTGLSVAAFAINSDGSLSAVPGSPFAVPGVVAMAVHPSGEYLYFSTGLDHRIAAYRIGANGALTAVPGSPFWFDDFGQSNNLLGITVHRSGRFLLASDNSSHSIFVFGLDAATGALTGEVSRSFNLTLSRAILSHPDGQHVIAAGFDGIHVLTFDTANGVLTPVPGSPFASSYLPEALALDHTGTKLYGVNGDQGAASDATAFSIISVHNFDPVSGAIVRTAVVNAGGILFGVALTSGAAPDTTPPPPPVITQHPLDPSAPSTSLFTFAFSDLEAGVTFDCRLDAAPFAACVSPVSYSGPLTPGPHAFTVRAHDAVGNISDPASFSWQVDAPYQSSFTNLSAPQTIIFGTASVSVTGTIAAPGAVFPIGEIVTVTVNGQSRAAAVGAGGAFTAMFSTAAFAASPSPYAIGYAFAGNADLMPASDASTTLTVTPATAAISVSGFSVPYDGQPHGATGTAIGVLGENLNAFLDLGATFINAPGGTAHWTFSGNPDYVPASGDVAITIMAPPPPPVITQHPADPSAPSTGLFTFAFSDLEAGVTFECWLDAGPFAACASPVSYSGPLTAGKHTFIVRALNAAGTSSAPASFSWLVDAPHAAAFSSLSASQTIVYGSASVTVSGTIAAPGPMFPIGAIVTVTMNGQSRAATVGAGGAFSAMFSTAAFGAAPSPYVIRYAFVGNADFTPASDASTTLTVTPAIAAISVSGFSGPYDGQPHGATGTAIGVLGENLNAFLNLGATFINAPGGTAHWTFSGNPDYVPASGNVAITITAPPPSGSPDGRMFGAGHITAAGKHHHFIFRVRQINNRDYGRFEYWVNDPRTCRQDDDYDHDGDLDGDHDKHYGRDHRDPPGRFEATSIDTVAFADEVAVKPGKQQDGAVDTVTFSGKGKWNGRTGYTFEVTSTDRGEPGRSRDTFVMVIKDARGAVVASVNGTLDGGNVQSKRLKK